MTGDHFTMTYLRAAAFACGLVALSGCASAAHNRRISYLPQEASAACLAPTSGDPITADRTSYRIQPGDELDISFYLSGEFNQDVVVRPDGKITLKLVGDLRAGGLTPEQLSSAIDEVYESELRHPFATVLVKESGNRRVYVEGEVVHPGAVPLHPQLTALQAIAQSGGLTDSAGTDQVILARRDACGRVSTQRLDLARALKGVDMDQDVGLLPSDLLIVPRSGIANVGLVVKQYVRDLLPVDSYMSGQFPPP